MIAPWIIEEIERREREREEQQRLPLYIDEPTYEPDEQPQPDGDEQPRGVVVIDLL